MPSMQNTRILMITTHPFWGDPLGNGSLVRSRYRVLSEIFEKVFVLYLSEDGQKNPLNGGTLHYNGVITSEVLASINKIISEYHINACYFSYIQTETLANNLPTFNIVEIHDVLHLRSDQFAAYGFSPPIEITKELELKLLKSFDLVLCINIDEAGYLTECGIENVKWLPPSENFNAHRLEQKNSAIATAGFVGSCAAPNIDGIAQIRALIQKLDSFIMAGPISKDVEVVAKLPDGVQKLGVINDLSNFYKQVSVTVSPIRFGAGLKIKVFESLANGIGVLATEHSIQGFPDGIRDVAVVDPFPEAWSVGLVEQAERINKERIRSYFEEHFSHQKVITTLQALIPRF